MIERLAGGTDAGASLRVIGEVTGLEAWGSFGFRGLVVQRCRLSGVSCLSLEAFVALTHLIVRDEGVDVHCVECEEVVLAVIAGVGGDE